MCAIDITVASFFAVSLGFILSAWRNATSRFHAKLLDPQARRHGSLQETLADPGTSGRGPGLKRAS
jgi:hypothetical protein